MTDTKSNTSSTARDKLDRDAMFYTGRNGLQYHNVDHITEVSKATDELLSVYECELTVDEVDAVKIAALWHDAFYIPGATDGVNEKASAAMLTHYWRLNKIQYPFSCLHIAQKLIEETKISSHLAYETGIKKNMLLLDILLDADLHSLSVPYTEFVKNQGNIIEENGGDRLNVFDIRRSANFLDSFLHRKNIYRTGYAIQTWEEQAKRNILMWLERAYSLDEKKWS